MNIQSLPDELLEQHGSVTLAIDVTYFNKIFLMSWGINFGDMNVAIS